MYPCFYSTSEWDTCAPHIIVEEAGGTVLPYDGLGSAGMAGVAELLLSRDAAAARAAAATAAAAGDASTSTAGASAGAAALGDAGGASPSSSRVDNSLLSISYNKPDLLSPPCVYLGQYRTN